MTLRSESDLYYIQGISILDYMLLYKKFMRFEPPELETGLRGPVWSCGVRKAGLRFVAGSTPSGIS